MKLRKELWKKRLAQVAEWVHELVNKLSEVGVRVEEVKIFGSTAKGDFIESSDVDMVIVSQDWSGMSFVDRLAILYRLWDKPVDAHFIPLTRRELEKKIRTSVALRDASRYWITIYRVENSYDSSTIKE